MISDRLGRIHIPLSNYDIVSLVPSWTEYLVDIGEYNNIIGRTEYCIRPQKVKKIEEIGGTKNPNIDTIIRLKPDLVIANKEENKQYDINRLRANGLSVLVTGAITLIEAIEEMKMIEDILHNTSELANQIEAQVNMKRRTEPLYSFVYLVWKDPLMVASHSTYISHVITASGGTNLISMNWENRYPQIQMKKLQKLDPDFVFLPDEPYKFTEQDKKELSEVLPNSVVDNVDGKLASWYGKRIISGIEYFNKPIKS